MVFPGMILIDADKILKFLYLSDDFDHLLKLLVIHFQSGALYAIFVREHYWEHLSKIILHLNQWFRRYCLCVFVCVFNFSPYCYFT